MANHPSAEKRNRQRIKRAEKNRGVRSSVRTAVKKARTLAESGDPKAAEAVAAAEKKLARAAQKGVLHKNAAARTTSRMRHALTKQA